MSTNTVQSSYTYIHDTLGSYELADHSVGVYTFGDRVTFDAYLSPFHPINDLSTKLQELNTKLVIQASNTYIGQAIDLA